MPVSTRSQYVFNIYSDTSTCSKHRSDEENDGNGSKGNSWIRKVLTHSVNVILARHFSVGYQCLFSCYCSVRSWRDYLPQETMEKKFTQSTNFIAMKCVCFGIDLLLNERMHNTNI